MAPYKKPPAAGQEKFCMYTRHTNLCELLRVCLQLRLCTQARIDVVGFGHDVGAPCLQLPEVGEEVVHSHLHRVVPRG